MTPKSLPAVVTSLGLRLPSNCGSFSYTHPSDVSNRGISVHTLLPAWMITISHDPSLFKPSSHRPKTEAWKFILKPKLPTCHLDSPHPVHQPAQCFSVTSSLSIIAASVNTPHTSGLILARPSFEDPSCLLLLATTFNFLNADLKTSPSLKSLQWFSTPYRIKDAEHSNTL